ncbi:MAG: hypothetical protein HY831_05445 [Candidatus Aenigmarchaeota archaeon]|nr:hypothetical protein [Candidatus Aenigmarchaeota archaeon]
MSDLLEKSDEQPLTHRYRIIFTPRTNQYYIPISYRVRSSVGWYMAYNNYIEVDYAGNKSAFVEAMRIPRDVLVRELI